MAYNRGKLVYVADLGQIMLAKLTPGREDGKMKENVLERNARLDTERKIADFRVKQQMDYEFKVKYAKIRAWEFYDHPDVAGSCYVAVGGLDSITLLLFLVREGLPRPGAGMQRAVMQLDAL